MQIIKAAADIKKAITSIANRGAKLDGDIHKAGVSVLAHASEHGDSTLADSLVNAMPKGGRKLALVEWMLAHGQLAKLDPKADKEAIAAGRIFKLDRTRTLDLKAAIETSWVEFKKEAAVHTAFDAQAAVKAVLARLKAANEKGLTVEHKAEALAEAQALVAALGG
ncbi:hypothetical protein SnaR1_gp2 [Sphaerotilus phage vB_SnaP-R1]|uniref:Uncharacterized protein n=1 Tax=Sphaerotilus phage vB_SnaP-R1 TaxID=2696336 RepID=A0A6B9SUI6_9CAUD|nr:hypothetical protein SnaR1_gp2 [Sphaerotilus phage vB_SnaP-R1]